MDLAPSPLVLASASPRRRELLESLGLTLSVRPVDLDETPATDEKAGDYVRRIAGEKCDAAWAALAGEDRMLGVLGADTIVILDGGILGKPRDRDDARAMLQRLAGRRHEVTTAYRIRRGERMVERAVTTLVSFRLLQPGEVDAYLACGEWNGKAGGYAVQGVAGAFTTELRGSHTNVIGLPLAEVLGDLVALEALPGYPPPSFRAPP